MPHGKSRVFEKGEKSYTGWDIKRHDSSWRHAKLTDSKRTKNACNTAIYPNWKKVYAGGRCKVHPTGSVISTVSYSGHIVIIQSVLKQTDSYGAITLWPLQTILTRPLNFAIMSSCPTLVWTDDWFFNSIQAITSVLFL